MSNWQLPEDFRHLHSGKVRDLYETATDTLLMVASDQISAFDFILPTIIPNKGKILTEISLFWFNRLAVPNHLISTIVPSEVAGRAIEVKKLKMLPIECVVRGYLTGSAWLEYQVNQSVCGIKLPAGLVNGSKLAAPIYTPATKAQQGDHDENISFDQSVEILGNKLATQVMETSISIFNQAQQILNSAGFTLIDTKFEFGLDAAGVLTLADEALTPDSSRYCNTAEMTPDKLAPSFDKQLVRNWLLENWDKDAGTPPPELPTEIVKLTQARYQEVLDRLKQL
ncbi:MAG: phosphoribosylaminoimidazolesuccinocarboxamide synthase [Actinobacteria bacterium]|nr:phosphoribosylaminoimidazolesuccinocarboxamide synthase [Actinomycetota bacterium]